MRCEHAIGEPAARWGDSACNDGLEDEGRLQRPAGVRDALDHMGSSLASVSTVHREDSQISKVENGPCRTALFPHVNYPQVRFV